MRHHGFREVRRTAIATLALEVVEYVHKETGARHYHLAADHPESAFMVALRTMPEDSSGVAHVLEHTTLCGSTRYPVRDPFFAMLRRSLSSFMNAFTAGDYTAYPFASISAKDFDNLLGVYLDAVFFPRLNPLDFAQEGHRLAFSDPKDPCSNLVYKGVVYNEMKGDMSSPRAVLWEVLNKALFPTITYGHNSGGDPACIPDLTYDQLKAFHRRHYHPSNAIFMTFGRINVEDFHDKVAVNALDHFEHASDPVFVPLEQRFQSPIQVEASFSADDQAAGGDQGHLVVAWLLGESTDLKALLEATLLTDVLLDHSGSPLRRVLESFPQAEAVSPLTGLEESHREMSFRCGVEGADPDAMAAFEAVVLDTIADVASNGIAIEQLEGVLHQIELSQREVGGDGMPYGLQLIFACLPGAIHDGDPVGLLDLDTVLAGLRRDIQDPEFIKDLAARLLRDNQHRVSVVLRPDSTLGAKLEAAERAKLKVIEQQLTAHDRQQLMAEASALDLRQAQDDDLEILPKVTLEDVPLTRDYPMPSEQTGVITYAAGCNGLVYYQQIRRVPKLSLEEWRLIPLLNHVFGELGFGHWDYAEAQLQQQSKTAGLNAFVSLRADREHPDRFRAYFAVSSRALGRNAQSMIELLDAYVQGVRFNEFDRLTELVRQFNTRRRLGMLNQAHSLAMLAASAAFSPVAALNHQLSGFEALAPLKKLTTACEQDGPGELGHQLAQLFGQIQSGPSSALIVADANELSHVSSALGFRSDRPGVQRDSQPLSVELEALQVAYVLQTQVNFCAAAYACANESSPDAAAIHVFAAILRNHYLHTEIREKGGAYGAGASYDAANGVFRMYSYRDPGLLETLSIFDQAGDVINVLELTELMIEEAILGLVSGIDAPGSPAGEARDDCFQRLHGREPALRLALRHAIVTITTDDVRRVARAVLAGPCSQVVVTDKAGAGLLPESFDIRHI